MSVLTERELNERLAAIEANLLKELPAVARSVAPSEPAYCLFLQYVDFSACDEFRPLIGWKLTRIRSALIERHGDDAQWYLWNPYELDNIERLRTYPVGDDTFHRTCKECYLHFFDLIGDRVPEDAEDEASILLPFRQMIHRVSLRLNAIDWSREFNVTTGFVVAPMDWVGGMAWRDMEAGIPRDRLNQLRQRNLFCFMSEYNFSEDS